jgi:hypothetical protein
MIVALVLFVIIGLHYLEVRADWYRFTNVPADFRQRIAKRYDRAAVLLLVSAVMLAALLGKKMAGF